MKKILYIASLALLWSSCSNDECCPSPGSEDQIGISAAIATLTPTPLADTRTTISGSTAAWANGDALGLYCAQSIPAAVNDQFTVSGIGTTPVWTPATAIYWKDGTTAHTFLAYAPYASGNSDPAAVKLPTLNTQTGTIDATKDFLISNNLGTSGSVRTAAVGLVFTHALSLIQFDLVLGAGIAAGTTLTSATLAAGSSDKLYTTDATSTINLSTAAINLGAGTNTATVTPASPPTISATPYAFYTLVLPGTYTAPTVTLNIKEGGTTALTTAAASLVTTTFEAGKKYTYTVTVSRTLITISNPTITDWTTVVGSPINPGI